MKNLFIVIFYIALLPFFIFADTINVPADTSTIQGGISLATNGDIVLVAEGTYYENINFKGKLITVASHFLMDGDTSHISATIIDGSQNTNPDSGSVVYFISGEDTNSVLYGFTITGGTGTLIPSGPPPSLPFNLRVGGGILCRSDACISNNRIVNNSISSSSMISVGAGIIAGAGTPGDMAFVIIENNYICFNTVSTQGIYLCGGGGIAFGCRGRITNNDISYNQVISQNVQGTGGGLSLQYAKEVILAGNTISHNKIIATSNFEWGGHGGGLSTYHGWDLIIKGNRIFSNEVQVAQKSNGAGVLLEKIDGSVFENNTVFDNYNSGAGTCNGGGVCIWECEVILNANEIYGNNGTYGGGIFVSDSSGMLILTNNIVSKNHAQQGGGIYVTGPQTQAQIINNTIVADTADFGGGIFTINTSPVIINSILWNNDAVNGAQIYRSGGNTQVVYCDVQGGWAGEGNIDVDPLFVPGDYLYHLTDVGDTSSCLNAGIDAIQINGNWYYAPNVDFGGNPRPQPDTTMPDMGSWESDVINSLEEIKGLSFPKMFVLNQNYPNPFNPTTNIEFSIPKTEFVNLKIYNLLGQEVATLVSDKLTPGKYKYTWDASDFASGIYFYKIEIGGPSAGSPTERAGQSFVQTKKLILIR